MNIFRRVFVGNSEISEEGGVVVAEFAQLIDAARPNEWAGIGCARLEYDLLDGVRGGMTAAGQCLHGKDSFTRRLGRPQFDNVWFDLLNHGDRCGGVITDLNGT